MSSPRCIRGDSHWSRNKRTLQRMCTINHSKKRSKKSSTNITQGFPIKIYSWHSAKWMRSKISPPDRLLKWCRTMRRLRSCLYRVKIPSCSPKISARIQSPSRRWWRTRTSGCARASASCCSAALQASGCSYGCLLRYSREHSVYSQYQFEFSSVIFVDIYN